MEFASENIPQLLQDYKPLIYKTMQRLNIRSNHMDYDDFFQELQIKLISIYRAFDGNPLQETNDRYRFTSYAGNGLYWYGLNLLRKEKQTVLQLTDNEQMDWLLDEENVMSTIDGSDLVVKDFLNEAKKRLSDQEYILLLYTLEGIYTIQELANIMNVSRDTIYQRKNRMKKKLSQLKECLIS